MRGGMRWTCSSAHTPLLRSSSTEHFLVFKCVIHCDSGFTEAWFCYQPRVKKSMGWRDNATVINLTLTQGFITSRLFTFWARSFFFVEGCCPGHLTIFSGIPGLYTLDAHKSPSTQPTIRKICRHCQIFPLGRGQKSPWLRTSALDLTM